MRDATVLDHAGRRFIVWPVPDGTRWQWREHGTSDVHEVESERNAYLCIGGYCALLRIREGVTP